MAARRDLLLMLAMDCASIPEIVELNIGHAIVSRAVFDGLTIAVSEMKRIMTDARGG